MEPREVAERCARAMFDQDAASQNAQMRIEEMGPGFARVSMRVAPVMINGHLTAHGGAVFTLADSAFAFACNSRNVRTVAQHCSITFVTPAREGEMLIAEARENHVSGRSGIYDVTVRADDGRTVAIFRGHSAATRDAVLPT